MTTHQTSHPSISLWAQLLRAFAWVSVTLVFAYTLNNFLIYVGGTGTLFSGHLVALMLYSAALILGLGFAALGRGQPLNLTAVRLTDLNRLVVRGAFWAVFLVGMVDMTISFLRIEDLATLIFGEDLAGNLNRQTFRGTYVHMPLVALGFVLAFFTRGLGFIWLTLLVVFAQLSIVITVNIFSYEQAFQADLVRFWYAALFLFAAAYTLLEGGHVRVDVLYEGFSKAQRKRVSLWGALLLGLPLAWSTLVIGTWDQTRIINAPLLRFEIGQQSVGGLYIKYLMAGFLIVLAISLIIQFCALILDSLADDASDEPDKTFSD